MKNFISGFTSSLNKLYGQHIGQHKDWPNTQTALSTTSVAFNLASFIMHNSIEERLALNAPVRIVSIVNAFYTKRFDKIALDIPAFFVLALPNGGLISVIIDVVSEILNLKRKTEEIYVLETPRIDPNIKDNALKLLAISDQEEDFTLEKIQAQYSRIITDLRQKKEKLPEALAFGIQLLINDVDVAKTTLLRYVH